MKAKTYKQIIADIAAAETKDDLATAGGEIETSYQAEKITFNDLETLYKIINKLYKALEA